MEFALFSFDLTHYQNNNCVFTLWVNREVTYVKESKAKKTSTVTTKLVVRGEIKEAFSADGPIKSFQVICFQEFIWFRRELL